MDKLEQIFKKQKELQQKILNKEISELLENQEFINLNILACFSELNEILSETQWKNPYKIKYGWKKTQEFKIDKYKDELIDLLHFYVNLCISAGIEPNEIYSRYMKKNKINHSRKERGY